MSQKSYDKTPTLYLIPTPIGNLDDITLRTIKILQEVEILFCEDTRVTGQLLSHLGIKKKMISNHLYNETVNCEKALSYLKQGYDIGLVSDRGTPIISDPGYELVSFVIEHSFHVVSLPGATAFVPALLVSGLSPQPFLFYGFLNSKQSKRKKELEMLEPLKYTMIFYEAPHRILQTLEDFKQILGNRNICICREITKKFEEIYRGTIEEVLMDIETIKGEIVIVIDGNKDNHIYDSLNIVEHVNLYIEEGLSSKEAIKKVARERAIRTSEVYEAYHKNK